MKKVAKYTIISLLLLLGLCCLGVLYMFFVPNAKLFGVTYISKNVKVASAHFDVTQFSGVKINSRAYDLNIVATDNDKVYAEIDSRSFGFVLEKNSKPEIEYSIKNGYLNLNIIEPHGFMLKNNSSVTVYLPNNLDLNVAISNKSANVYVADAGVCFNDLYYTSESGTLKLIKGSVEGALDLDLAKSVCTIDNTFLTNENALKLSLTSGKFLANETIFGNVEVKANKRGVIKIYQCKDFIYKPVSAGGSVHVSNLEQVQVNTSDTDLYLGKISSGGNINISASGNVSINELNGDAFVTTNSGIIAIGKSISPVSATTDSGNITINNAYQRVTVNANSGRVTVNFAEDAGTGFDNALNSYYRTLYAHLNNAYLSASGVEHVGAAGNNTGIDAYGNGRVWISMKNVYGENSIKSNSNNIFVQVEKTSIYTLTTSSSHGSVRVNLAQIAEYNGYTDISRRITYVNSTSISSNSLTVRTAGGHMVVVDTLLS